MFLLCADSERKCLNEEKEAFQAFRSQVLRELREQQYRLQVISMHNTRFEWHGSSTLSALFTVCALLNLPANLMVL